jgi:serine/threonine protein phosphatase 1
MKLIEDYNYYLTMERAMSQNTVASYCSDVEKFLEAIDLRPEFVSTDDITGYLHWTQDGGDVTAKQFSKLDEWDKEDILDYLSDASFYEEVHVGGKHYILVHGGLSNFSKDRSLADYDLSELLFQSPDYNKRYFEEENVFLLTGHTPTLSIPGHEKPEIYRKNGHIAIDCGCVFGGRLAAICLDTGEEYYVDSHQ